ERLHDQGWKDRAADGSAEPVMIAELMRMVGRDRIEVTRNTMPADKASSEAEQRDAYDRFKYRGPPSATHATYAWCAQFVEVRVDEDYGTVRVRRMVGAFDCGRLYNPKLAESQWKGGMIMGMGEALLEAIEIDRRYARITNNNLADYAVPANADVPDMEVISAAARERAGCVISRSSPSASRTFSPAPSAARQLVKSA